MVISDLWHRDLLEEVFRAEMVKKISFVLIILSYIKISPEIYWGSRMYFNQLINCVREFGEFIDKIILKTKSREIHRNVNAKLRSWRVESDWEESCS